MTQKTLSEFTDAELLLESKRTKYTQFMNAVLFGVMIGVATYSTVKNGFGILTFFPLLFIQMLVKNRSRKKAVDALVKERNLA
ncbi:FUSC family protein [Chryseobacterium sp. H3056]|uniref:FUSC family protein n=1 Tax=Kaistella daneshvariae TaxID=2487074 RepID=A0A3N0WXP7_9FLAO|nr:FUSC family protein [Kaistella daneshvariae]ROI09753.1 FUSC family protein [Kaistella daneshvariae]